MDMRLKSVYISKKFVVNIVCEMNKKVLIFIFYVFKVQRCFIIYIILFMYVLSYY